MDFEKEIYLRHSEVEGKERHSKQRAWLSPMSTTLHEPNPEEWETDLQSSELRIITTCIHVRDYQPLFKKEENHTHDCR